MKRIVQRHWNTVILSATLLAGAPAHAQPVPTNEAGFTDFVAAQMRRQPLGDQEVTIKGPLTLSVGGLQANLDRVYRFCRADGAACQEEIDRYTQAVAQTLKDVNAPLDKGAVRLVVRPVGYVQQYEAAAKRKLQSWPLAGDLVVVPVLDTPRTIRSLIDSDFKKLGLDADGVHQLGLANLASTLKPLMSQARVAAHKQIGNLAGDPYESSRLAMHATWAPLVEAQGGVLIAVAPAKDLVLYIGEDTPQAVDALQALAAETMKRMPNPLSPTLLRWTKSGWEVVR